jgi:hypothetical protein
MPFIDERLDQWLPRPAIRIAHRRSSRAAEDELWQAARSVRLRDTQLLGRLVRWRIPGIQADLPFDELFRQPPFAVLEQDEHALLSGIVGRIWTLRRDYPELSDPEEFRDWSARGTARVLFATWTRPRGAGGATLFSEVRLEPFGAQGRVGVATVRPIVSAFQGLIGSDGITVAVRLAERGTP